MGLLQLKTNLKSLKYGNDRQGGGSSNQPFVQQSIPEGQIPYPSELAIVGQDTERITKWFTTTPGLLFIGKQNVLSQTNVRTQANNFEKPNIVINGGPYIPTNTIAQVAGVNFGSHFYKQGLTPGGSRLPKYSDAIKSNQPYIENRLFLLYGSKIQNLRLNLDDTLISSLPTEILKYTGGPGSVLGVGSTIINFSSGNRTGINNPLYTDNRNQFYGIFPTTNKVIVDNPAKAIETFQSEKTYQNTAIVGLTDFRKVLREGITNSNILSDSPDYNTQNIENRVNLGDPGKRNKNIISYTRGLGEALDKITAKSLYRSELVDLNQTNDLVKFRIEAIDNDAPNFGVFMHFRAFIDSFNDNYTADWSSTQYVGRGEKFYNYNSFDRTINMSWTVAAQSKEELIPMYQKLNFLASNIMPDYNANGYMRGSLIRITVGGYLYSQPGFLTSLTYDIPQESSWEIGINDAGAFDNSVKELPHMIKVTATFTPIHTFAPRKQVNTYSGSADIVSSFGPQRYIALSTGNNNNYDN